MILRGLWLVTGFLGVATGTIGVVVPGIPTVGPFIFAAWCFSKSSPRFERWILELPGVGPMVSDYRDGLGMPKRAKIMAIAMMWLAITISVGLVLSILPVQLLIVALGVIGTIWILRVPTQDSSSVGGSNQTLDSAESRDSPQPKLS